jgi:hypothetical protein
MRRPRGHLSVLAALVALVVGALACSVGPLPDAGGAPPACTANCPPPQRSAATPHTATIAHATLIYFNPWSVDSSSSGDVVLVAQSQLGQISVELASSTVSPGITAGQLVSRAAKQLLDPNDYSGVQDAGPILGAEIGYVPGAGEAYTADTTDPNAPSTPVYLQVMASVRGNVGLMFAALSPLDPGTADPTGAPDQVYDELVNSVEWT